MKYLLDKEKGEEIREKGIRKVRKCRRIRKVRMEGSTQAPLGAQSTDVHHEAQPSESAEGSERAEWKEVHKHL
jgi:hypothetical protein